MVSEVLKKKVNKSRTICETNQITFKIKQEKKIKRHKLMAAPILLYRSEAWLLKKDTNKIKSIKIKFLWNAKTLSILDKIQDKQINKDSQFL